MKLRNDLTLRKIGGEYLIVEPGKGTTDLSNVYSLNWTAAWLWDELKGKEFTTEDVARLLIEEYQLDPRTAYIDGDKILTSFRAQNLILP
ncbi:PqqD family protein [Sphingobacterium sp.]|uniref:PqqD family protein n=1 Tax=Sphingobacterium sp. TaxID=341027 RepID=UPI0028B1C4DB|nr:PqqD family protein [Sphingobacterium sp.]